MADKYNLAELVQEMSRSEHATNAGSNMHKRLQAVILDVENAGDDELIQRIKQRPELIEFFQKNSQTEVPIAGKIRGRFVSRRIDRLCINHDTKSVRILDYKTDTNPDAFRDKYTLQIREYVTLMREIYPDYSISGYILWLHDWKLEKIV